MRCRKARKLISLYLAPHGLGLSPRSRHALEAHLAVCEPCRRDRQEGQKLIRLLQRHWQISADTQALLKRARLREHKPFLRETMGLPGRFHRVATWALATAACLVIGVLGGRITSDPATSGTGARDPVVSWGGDPHLVIESPDDGSRITPGAVIQTPRQQVRSLILNRRHRLVMNAGTRLSVEPLAERERTGCLVKLALGEVYVRVEHDGSPFVVQTAQAKAVITGTTFDVKATDAGTVLVVAEGSVRFESETGAVQVRAGQQSRTAATLAVPSTPTACDVIALTAWAGAKRGVSPVVQDIRTDDSLWDDVPVMPSSWAQVPTNPDRIDSTQWIERKRDWFTQQFPWIFELKEALNRENIEADYPALLLQSGEIWRFVYPGVVLERQVGPDPNGLLRAAMSYARDKSWLQHQALPSLQATGTEQPMTASEAFERWIESIQADLCPPKLNSGVLLDTANACLYLAHTRTLAILLIRNGWEGPAPHLKEEILGLLQEELRTLAQCVELLQGLDLARANVSTCQSLDRLNALIDGIGRVRELEKRMKEYEEVFRP